MSSQDISLELQARVNDAMQNNTTLSIQGGNSKSFYGRITTGEIFNVSGNQGIIHYEPTELVITARAGTHLREIEQALAENNQLLAFEPPYYGNNATLGGTISCNLSGPRRAAAGAARDFVLGCKILNGKGEIICFGGEVMKNVAGYDVSRLMTGALGTLGVLLEISLKVLPKPEAEITLTLEYNTEKALAKLNRLSQINLPISASCYDGDRLFLRLSGTQGAVDTCKKAIGGEIFAENQALWQKIKEQQHGFFTTEEPLWRLSVAADSPSMNIEGKYLYEWNGALRWLVSNAPAETIRTAVEKSDGHATRYRGHNKNCVDIFHPLPTSLLSIHKKLKQAFDPQGIFNPGRMYPGL
ncbi:glycolate oxidase subunit GlcE [Beggiatoa alba]|nr:glycolate oxidase subunit GlcE [Beggiatoa alba]MBN4069047.1 glycolate oxidase subunit GlcE [Beggiatoa alba]